ncbi:MAG: hypothetical protein H6Q90_7233 [Deltaproteobacteria bacterium]|nr:hypothetical protein [Deltaproteobacteria bacterium]
MTLGLLVLLLVVQKPCADSVSKLVTGFGDVGSGSAINMPKPGTVALRTLYTLTTLPRDDIAK